MRFSNLQLVIQTVFEESELHLRIENPYYEESFES